MALREPTHIPISTGRPNTDTIATASTSHLASGVERRAHVHMEHIVAEGRPNGLYNQFSLVHMDIMHHATETFYSRMDDSAHRSRCSEIGGARKRVSWDLGICIGKLCTTFL
jgi:hypothetical protein